MRIYFPLTSFMPATGTWKINPLQLFQNGEFGLIVLPIPVWEGQQLLYTDEAATTPVTQDGDPVGFMRDLSPNEFHFRQATEADRPIYRTDGTTHWLEFDGISQCMRTVPLPGHPTTEGFCTVLAAEMLGESSNNGMRLGQYHVSGEQRAWSTRIGAAGGTDYRAGIAENDNFITSRSVDVDATSQPHVMTLDWQGPGNPNTARMNGDVHFPGSLVTYDRMGPSDREIDLGVYQTASNFFEGKFFGATVRYRATALRHVVRLEAFYRELAGL